jgi:undecaprenyl-diphosphatase
LSLLEAFILGLLQGATEFLPVSSSGHLVLVQALMRLSSAGVGFEVLVHVATLLAVVICLKKDVAGLVKGLLSLLRRVFGARRAAHTDEERLALAVVTGTIPAVAASLLLGDWVQAAFGRPDWAAGFLLVTGAVLLLTRLCERGERRLGPGVGLIIGLAQAMALLPGVSRSGFTIAAAIFLGVPRGDAVRFSFLLAVPAIGGAFLYTLASGPSGILEVPALPSAAAFLAALASGCIAILVLLRAVKRGRFELFGLYCLAAGALALALTWHP